MMLEDVEWYRQLSRRIYPADKCEGDDSCDL
jgi:hypothetical protein